MIQFIFDILESILLGFGIYSILFVLVNSKIGPFYGPKLMKFDVLACQVAAFSGAFFFVYSVIIILLNATILDYSDLITGNNSASGLKIYLFLYQAFFYVFSQFFWSIKIRNLKIFRIILSLPLMVSVPSILRLSVIYNSDFNPEKTQTIMLFLLNDFFNGISIFFTAVFFLAFLKSYLKKPIQR